jgi:hypothetical protein
MIWSACRVWPQAQRQQPFVVFSILQAYTINSHAKDVTVLSLIFESRRFAAAGRATHAFLLTPRFSEVT